MEMKTLNLDAVKEIRDLARKNDRNYCNFVSELEKILKTQKPGEWFKRPVDVCDVTLDEVWEQKLGTIKYHKTIHTFSCMYVPNQGVTIREHGHNQLVHKDNNGDIKKTRELYIFYVPSSLVEMKFCRKDETHKLCNNYGCPVYVISAKVTGRG